MTVQVHISRDELQDALRFLRNGLKQSERNKPDIQLELEIFQTKGVLRLRGAEYEAKLSSDRFCKITMPLKLLWQVVRTDSADMFKLSFSEGKLVPNSGIELSSNKIKMMHPEELATPDLPLNYNYGHVLKLSMDYDEQEQERMGIRADVIEAHKELDKALNIVSKSLEKFNIPKKDVERFIHQKLFN